MIKNLSLIKLVIIVGATLPIAACSNDAATKETAATQSNLSVDTDTGLGVSVENGDISNIFSKAKDKIASVFTVGEEPNKKAQDAAIVTKKNATGSDDWREKRQWWQRGTPVL